MDVSEKAFRSLSYLFCLIFFFIASEAFGQAMCQDKCDARVSGYMPFPEFQLILDTTPDGDLDGTIHICLGQYTYIGHYSNDPGSLEDIPALLVTRPNVFIDGARSGWKPLIYSFTPNIDIPRWQAAPMLIVSAKNFKMSNVGLYTNARGSSIALYAHGSAEISELSHVDFHLTNSHSYGLHVSADSLDVLEGERPIIRSARNLTFRITPVDQGINLTGNGIEVFNTVIEEISNVTFEVFPPWSGEVRWVQGGMYLNRSTIDTIRNVTSLNDISPENESGAQRLAIDSGVFVLGGTVERIVDVSGSYGYGAIGLSEAHVQTVSDVDVTVDRLGSFAGQGLWIVGDSVVGSVRNLTVESLHQGVDGFEIKGSDFFNPPKQPVLGVLEDFSYTGPGTGASFDLLSSTDEFRNFKIVGADPAIELSPKATKLPAIGHGEIRTDLSREQAIENEDALDNCIYDTDIFGDYGFAGYAG